jgi:hypothetical protein
MEWYFYKCYINDLYTTKCTCVLGHRNEMLKALHPIDVVVHRVAYIERLDRSIVELGQLLHRGGQHHTMARVGRYHPELLLVEDIYTLRNLHLTGIRSSPSSDRISPRFVQVALVKLEVVLLARRHGRLVPLKRQERAKGEGKQENAGLIFFISVLTAATTIT